MNEVINKIIENLFQNFTNYHWIKKYFFVYTIELVIVVNIVNFSTCYMYFFSEPSKLDKIFRLYGSSWMQPKSNRRESQPTHFFSSANKFQLLPYSF